jgi:hypothetical protein
MLKIHTASDPGCLGIIILALLLLLSPLVASAKDINPPATILKCSAGYRMVCGQLQGPTGKPLPTRCKCVKLTNRTSDVPITVAGSKPP